MRDLKFAIPAVATALALSASPAEAQQPFSPATFQNVANVFNVADLDRNGNLSSREYVLLRTGTIDKAWLRNYPGHAYSEVMPAVVAGFSLIDANSNASISRPEFLNAARSLAKMRNTAYGRDSWDWQPEYISASYYLIANRMDADSFNGRKVMNLDGEELGILRDIMRHEQTGDYYALVSMSEKVMDKTPSQYRASVIGVPLNDIVLATDGASLMLSERGERYFVRDPELPRVSIDRLKQVDTLYAV